MRAEAVNYFPDPGFEGGALNNQNTYLQTGVTGASRVTRSPLVSGGRSLRVFAQANSYATSNWIIALEWRFPAAYSEVWSVGGLVGYADAGLFGALSASFRKAGVALLGGRRAAAPVAQKAPAPLVMEGLEVPPEADEVALRLELWQSGPSKIGGVHFDDVIVADAPELPDFFFSGDSGGAEWLGQRYNSPSRLRPEPEDFETRLEWVPPIMYAQPLGLEEEVLVEPPGPIPSGLLSAPLDSLRWAGYDSGGPTVLLERLPAASRTGGIGFRGRRTAGAGHGGVACQLTTDLPALLGKTVQWACDVKAPVGRTITCFVDHIGGAGGYEAFSTNYAATGGWQRISTQGLIKADKAGANVYAWISNAVVGDQLDVDRWWLGLATSQDPGA